MGEILGLVSVTKRAVVERKENEVQRGACILSRRKKPVRKRSGQDFK